MFNLNFNTTPNHLLHLDLNSCFATVEQQANPFLRGKPVAVAAYDSPGGCIVAPSIEAKRLGIKVGMRVKEGKAIYPGLIVMMPDPNKYRFINRKLLSLLQVYTDDVTVKSIDEMVLDFTYSLFLKAGLTRIARTIKRRIRTEIGDWLTVSVGIGPNRFYAKLGAGLKKPDGLVEINKANVLPVLESITLEEIQGIKAANIARLNRVGIFTPRDFFFAKVPQLRMAFGGITGYYWYNRLHGEEIDVFPSQRKSYGHSYALYKVTSDNKELSQILCKLVEKMGRRLRRGNYSTSGIHLACLFKDWSFWHHGHKLPHSVYTNNDLYKESLKILLNRPSGKLVRILAVSCFHLEKNLYSQLSLLRDETRRYKLTQAIDEINNSYGEFVVTSGRMMGMDNKVIDRIAFGGVTDLEEYVFQEPVERETEFIS